MTQTPKLEELLCFSLYSVSLAMNKLYRKLLKPHNLTYPQYLVLVVLWQKNNITVSEIGEQLYLDSATLTPLLKRMEQAKLIKRTRAASDERRVFITLGAKGIKLKATAKTLFDAVGCASSLSKDDLKNIKSLLNLLRGKLLKNI